MSAASAIYYRETPPRQIRMPFGPPGVKGETVESAFQNDYNFMRWLHLSRGCKYPELQKAIAEVFFAEHARRQNAVVVAKQCAATSARRSANQSEARRLHAEQEADCERQKASRAEWDRLPADVRAEYYRTLPRGLAAETRENFACVRWSMARKSTT